jgi:hypothetical protein
MKITRRQIFLPALVLTLLVMIILTWVGEPLTTLAAPNGIISYEFAGSELRAKEILISWGEDGRIHAAFSLGFDFLFILAYTTSIGLACTWAGEVLRERKWPLGSVGTLFACGVCLAGLLDSIENIGLTTMLFGTVSSPWPQLAAACAAGKFLLIALALLYAAYGTIVWVFHHR